MGKRQTGRWRAEGGKGSERRWDVGGKYVRRCLTGQGRAEGSWEGLGSGEVRSAAIR